MADYYDSIASGYEELYSEEQMKKLFVIRKAIDDNNIPVTRGTTVLDVGCGTGIAQKFFEYEFGADTFGIDPSKKLLRINPLNCKQMKAEDMDFYDDEFEIVISLTAIQNFDDIEKGLKQIRRVGRIFILTFLKDCSKTQEIIKAIEGLFKIDDVLEEEKDLIYICRKISENTGEGENR